MERTPCPSCGAANLVTDPHCLACGAALRVRSAPVPAPEPASDDALEPEPERPGGVRGFFDLATEAGQRRTAIASGMVMLLCLLVLLPEFLMIFGGLIPGLLLLGWVMEARDRARDRAFEEGVKRGGGDRAALQAELARLHRPDRFVQTGRFPMKVRGFDSRLDDGGDGEAR